MATATTSSKTATQAGAAVDGAGKSDGKKKKNLVRSPKYPSITFKEATDKARLIYKHENRAATTPLVIFQHLGFKKKTGPAGRMLSALGQYGLLEKKGAGSYAISNKAFRLFNLPEDDPEHAQIVKELAMKPPLFKEIVAKYRTTGLPSDQTLKSYLVIDRSFNANSVQEFLRGFKASIEIAKPFDSGYTPPADDDNDPDFEGENFEGDQDVDTTPKEAERRIGQKQPPPPPPPPPPAGQLPFPLYLSKSQKAMLYVPSTMTPSEFKLLKKQIENSFVVMEATILSDDTEQ